jgi:hypothetical protein
VVIFGGEEGEEVRQFHGVEGERHNEERCGGREVEDGGWHLEVEDDQRKLGWWVKCAVRPNC